MVGPSNKQQKREAYRKAQAELHRAISQGKDGSSTPDNGGSSNGGPVRKIELPKKKFYRQRAHANPFSDHFLI